MDWNVIEADWAFWAPRIHAHLPELSADVLAQAGGDRVSLARHLAETYELTLLEADETLEELVLRVPVETAA